MSWTTIKKETVSLERKSEMDRKTALLIIDVQMVMFTGLEEVWS
ncbi:MAG: hypothetical protein ACOYVK_03450 [Bacillota bacterium]